MRQAVDLLSFQTPRRGLFEITGDLVGWVNGQEVTTGLFTAFCRHTSASLLIQENAAREVKTDIEAFFDRIAPEAPGLYAPDDEGPDDMPAHLRTALTQTHLSIPILEGRLALGMWQGIYMFEHRHRPASRQIAVHLIGD